MSWKLKYNSL